MENLLTDPVVTSVLTTVVTLIIVKGVALLKSIVLKTETKVDDAILQAIEDAVNKKASK